MGNTGPIYVTIEERDADIIIANLVFIAQKFEGASGLNLSQLQRHIPPKSMVLHEYKGKNSALHKVVERQKELIMALQTRVDRMREHAAGSGDRAPVINPDAAVSDSHRV